MSLIRTESLTKIYGKGEAVLTALDRVNLGVSAGEFVAVIRIPRVGVGVEFHDR